MDMNLGKLWEVLKDREPGMQQSLGLQSIGHDLATEQQQKIIDNVRVGVGDLEPWNTVMGTVMCCGPWICKEWDMTGRLNNNNK